MAATKTKVTRPCGGCSILMIEVRHDRRYCTATCRERHRPRVARGTRGRVGGGPLASLRDRELVRRYREAESGSDEQFALRDEIEIRVREHGAVTACGWVYTWNTAKKELRVRIDASMGGNRAYEGTSDKHVHRYPAALINIDRRRPLGIAD